MDKKYGGGKEMMDVLLRILRPFYFAAYGYQSSANHSVAGETVLSPLLSPLCLLYLTDTSGMRQQEPTCRVRYVFCPLHLFLPWVYLGLTTAIVKSCS